MTDREKLIELLDKITRVYRLDAWENTDKIADHLIANGVTVQEWIPVTEGLPEDDSRIEKNMVDKDFGFLTVLVYNGVVKQTNRYFSKDAIYGLPKTNGWEWATFNVTHWMPRPEPPKE